MTFHEAEFPYEEIRQASGDYFLTIQHAYNETGKNACHIWSVVEGEDDDGQASYCYGPPHHYVNLIGYIATDEKHDGETYYEEKWERNE